MKDKPLNLVKCFVEGNQHYYETILIINGDTIANGNVDDLKIFNTNHPLQSQMEELPLFIREKASFVLKEGKNDIEIKFKENTKGYKPNRKFNLALTRVGYNTPLFYFSSDKKSDHIKSKFYIYNDDLEPDNFKTSLGNKTAAFIYSESTLLFQAILNDNSLMVFGNTGGLTVLDLIDGDNVLKVRYKCAHAGDFTYYIQTPNFTKKITKTITKDQIKEFLVDTYQLQK